MNTVTGFIRDDGACGHYRVRLPLTKCNEVGAFRSLLIDTATSPAETIKRLSEADLVVIPRAYDDNMLDLIKRLKSHKIKVVIEHDDNMFDISPFSPHYAEFGTKDVTLDFNNEIVELWKDGERGFDLKLNNARLDGFRQAMELADAVQVTQPILADIYKSYNDKILTLPNCIDGSIWQKAPMNKRSNIRLFWSGGSSHYQDVLVLKDVLPEICNKYPNVEVHIMGCIWEYVFGGIPRDRLHFIDWTHTQAYPYRQILNDIDISLIPLEDNCFNTCKSNIKLIEQSFLGRPSIVSMCSPYKEFYNGTNMVMVDNEPESWMKAIYALVEDAQAREFIGDQAEKSARAQYDINDQWMLWDEAYNGLING